MLSPGCGGGAKSKGALYRETLRTTGFYMGRIVIVTREFTPIPSPPLRCHRFRESSRNAFGEARRNLSVRWGANQYPKKSAVPPPVGRPRGCGGRHREFTMRFCRRLLSFAERFKNARALEMRLFRHGGIYRSDEIGRAS